MHRSCHTLYSTILLQRLLARQVGSKTIPSQPQDRCDCTATACNIPGRYFERYGTANQLLHLQRRSAEGCIPSPQDISTTALLLGCSLSFFSCVFVVCRVSMDHSQQDGLGRPRATQQAGFLNRCFQDGRGTASSEVSPTEPSEQPAKLPKHLILWICNGSKIPSLNSALFLIPAELNLLSHSFIRLQTY